MGKYDKEHESFYASVFTTEEVADLARALAGGSLEDEIALLKVTIRRLCSNQGLQKTVLMQLEQARKCVETLSRVLKVQKDLKGSGNGSLSEAMAIAIEEMGHKLGVSL